MMKSKVADIDGLFISTIDKAANNYALTCKKNLPQYFFSRSWNI